MKVNYTKGAHDSGVPEGKAMILSRSSHRRGDSLSTARDYFSQPAQAIKSFPFSAPKVGPDMRSDGASLSVSQLLTSCLLLRDQMGDAAPLALCLKVALMRFMRSATRGSGLVLLDGHPFFRSRLA